MGTRRVAAALVLAAIALAGCGTDDGGGRDATTTSGVPRSSTTTEAATGSTVATGELAEGVVCDLDSDEFPTLEATEISRERLAEAGCETPPGGGLPEGDTLWAVPSGTDRNGIYLTSADGSPWVVTLDVPAPGCIQTMEWRGQMVLVVASDTKPVFKVERVEQPCG